MNKEYDYLVFVGRFQPFHIGHFSVLKLALQKSEKVIVIVGSANRPITAKNPISFENRRALIAALLSEEERKRVSIVPCDDFAYNDVKWETQIQTIVQTITMKEWRAGPTKIGMIGHSKDHSSYYLKKFPQWELYEIPAAYVINATDIRHSIYEGDELEPAWFVNQAHQDMIREIFYLPETEVCFREYQHIKNYKKQFAGLPYPPIFVTVDAVVICSSHILMVRRGGMPGEGQWALPGGFLNVNERIEDAVIRELIEETQIGVRLPKLKGSIKEWFVADNPDRSQRGRTISHAALIQLPDQEELPPIKGSDDAAHAQWIPLGELKSMQKEIFEDHYDIMDNFLGL